jgi:hypothetical protein
MRDLAGLLNARPTERVTPGVLRYVPRRGGPGAGRLAAAVVFPMDRSAAGVTVGSPPSLSANRPSGGPSPPKS